MEMKESREEYRKRWRSFRILCVTMFFDSLSFSIVISSMWPYLQKIDATKSISPIYLGWANIAFQLAGICIDFIMGFWVNKRGSTEPLIASMVLFGVGSFLYGYSQSMGSYGVMTVIISRAIIGFSTGIDVIARSVVAQSTSLKERTCAMAQMSIAQGAGFSFGPAIQLALIPLGDKGTYIEFLRLHLNLYTAPAFASIFIACLNLALLVGWYEECKINIYKDYDEHVDIMEYKDLIKSEEMKNPRWDVCAVVVTLFLYFTGQSAFAFQETILAPLAMYEFAWTKEETALWVGLMFFIAGIIAVAMFALTECLEKRINDRSILMIGFLVLIVGFTCYLPWGNSYPLLKTNPVTKNGSVSIASIVGCPEDLSWCSTTPKLHLPQIMFGMILLSIGYPFVMVITTTIYSKIVGPNPQGILQSWFAASGGLARTSGPALVSYLFVTYGPRWTFLSIIFILLFALTILVFSYHKLIPYHIYIIQKKKSIVHVLTNRDRLLTCSVTSSCLDELESLKSEPV